MSVELTGEKHAFYRTDTDTAFGPIFESQDQAHSFLEFLNGDPMDYPESELHAIFTEWEYTCWEANND